MYFRQRAFRNLLFFSMLHIRIQTISELTIPIKMKNRTFRNTEQVKHYQMLSYYRIIHDC